jgi:hypothetical protein
VIMPLITRKVRCDARFARFGRTVRVISRERWGGGGPGGYRAEAANRPAGARDAGSSEKADMCSVTRSTTSTVLLGTMAQPGWGHPELAVTTASGVAR